MTQRVSRAGWQVPHDRAMALCDDADLAWRRGLFAEAAGLFRAALPFERQAIRQWNGPGWWRRVLRDSFKSIAWCKRLAERGVSRREARRCSG